MRRSLSSRVFSLALSLWAPLFMSGAESLVRCPTHDGTAVAASQHGSAAAQSGDHDHGTTHSSSSGDGSEGHSCSCPGPGCCPPAVAVLPVTAVPMAHIVAVHAAAAVSALDRLASESDHVLPFSTAPPAVTLAPAASLIV